MLLEFISASESWSGVDGFRSSRSQYLEIQLWGFKYK